MMSNKNKKNNSSVCSFAFLNDNRNFFISAVLVLVIVTTGLYFKSLNNRLTNWDDDRYVTNNPDITTLHGDSVSYTIKKSFSSYVMGNYHPITMLSYCIEYSYFKLNPKPYHITNLIVHLLNTLLVLAFVWMLCKQKWVAFIAALLFAIHPMHVESVAWVAERKDVLYTFFFMLALCSYLFYLKNNKWSKLYYGLTLVLFVLSVLSKGMAVCLPITFFAVDYFIERKYTHKLVLEKVPFIVISIIFGLVSIEAQKSLSAVLDIQHYRVFDRILFSSYAVMMYFVKFFAPVNLSNYYNYPLRYNGWYPAIFYIAPFVLIIILLFIYQSKRLGREFWFGFGFFFITIATVLQILPVGGAIISDRYTYVPYIGLSFIIARMLNKVIENESQQTNKYKRVLLTVFFCFVLMLSVLTYRRTKVWKDSITLLSDAIEKSDIDPIIYMGRSQAYYLAGQYQKSIDDCNRFFSLNYLYPDVISDASMYYNRGIAYYKYEKYNEALADFNTIVKLQKNYPSAIYFRGLVYSKLGNYKQAIEDFNAAIELEKVVPEPYNDRGLAYFELGDYINAINDYNKAIELKPTFGYAYLNKGMVLFTLGKIDEAIQNYSIAIKYEHLFLNSYINRAIAYHSRKKNELAIADFTHAIGIDSKSLLAHFNRGLVYYEVGMFDKAIEDLSDVLTIDQSYIGAYYYRINSYINTRQFSLAMNDVVTVKKLGVNVPQNIIKTIQDGLSVGEFHNR